MSRLFNLTGQQENNIAIGIILIPIVLLTYNLMQPQIKVQVHAIGHVWYVAVGSVIAAALGALSYSEYLSTGYRKLYLLSQGFGGVSILYGIHAIITPGVSLINFYDKTVAINAFVFFGDASRLWFALLFFPQMLLDNEQDNERKSSVYILLTMITLSGASWFLLSNPYLFPTVKDAHGVDTYYAILVKTVTVVLILATTVRYYESWRIVKNTPLMALIVGGVLIAETPILFMLSKPWDSVWWLAHNVYSGAFLVIGIGLLVSKNGNQIQFFNVLGQVQGYVKQIAERDQQLTVAIEKLHALNEVLAKELEGAGAMQRRFLPEGLVTNSVRVEHIFFPRNYVSGDFFDYRLSENKLRGILFDVMGHGYSTALETIAVKILYSQADQGKMPLTTVLDNLNKQCLRFFHDSFLAAIVFEIDFENKTLTYASAGLHYIYLLSPSCTERIAVDSHMLGVWENAVFEQTTIEISSGSSVFFATDGITDHLDICDLNGRDFRSSLEFIKEIARKDDNRDDATALCITIH